MKTKKDFSDSLHTINLPGQEIFAVGTWNGDTYTENDLDDIVNAFNATIDKYKPFLKLGHNGDQHILINEGLPAAGWIENLRREGEKLICDFNRVPAKIAELISAGAWRQKSAEIYWDIKVGTENFSKMLRAVALLGADAPAVTDLNDIIELYGFEGTAASDNYKSYVVENKEVKHDEKEGSDMDELIALKAKLEESEKLIADYSEEKKTIEEEKQKLAAAVTELSAKVEAAEIEKRHAEINAYADKLIADKKILPAMREKVFALVDAVRTGVKTYNDVSSESILKEVLEAGSVSLPSVESTGAGGKQEVDDSILARKYADEHNVSFRDALIAVRKK